MVHLYIQYMEIWIHMGLKLWSVLCLLITPNIQIHLTNTEKKSSELG